MKIPDPSPDRHTLVLAPQRTLFYDMLELHLSRLSTCHPVFDEAAALALLADRPIHLVVVEDRADEGNLCMARVKLDSATCTIPVIRLYAKGPDPRERASFKVWENDSLIEPFDVRELFGLIRAELTRGSMLDRVEPLLHLTLRYSAANRARGEEAGLAYIGRTELSEDEKSKVRAAYREGLDNAFRHGNANNPLKSVDVNFVTTPHKISIQITDEGDGFDYERFLEMARSMDAVARARHSHAQKKLGGLGIKLMLECCDRLTYTEGGRCLLLEKGVSA
jgi:anti-sigma regulatory factor (Ser/Thr protein kinase)